MCDVGRGPRVADNAMCHGAHGCPSAAIHSPAAVLRGFDIPTRITVEKDMFFLGGRGA